MGGLMLGRVQTEFHRLFSIYPSFDSLFCLVFVWLFYCWLCLLLICVRVLLVLLCLLLFVFVVDGVTASNSARLSERDMDLLALTFDLTWISDIFV
jgi:hypothetical protein